MTLGMIFLIIVVIVMAVFEYNKKISTKKFINDVEPYFRFLMEDDYKFLLTVKYGEDIDVSVLYTQRIRNALVGMVAVIFVFITKLNAVIILLAVAAGFVMFKQQYMSLKSYYKANLYRINLLLPYFLKSLEILIQHYTVPVALSKSIDTAPEIFRLGLKRLVAKIEDGDSSVQPYMDFALEYPVRDSMRMMRLLYRLGLGSQENKQEQLLMFSRTVSSLQNKAREQRYADRLDRMEKKTMVMLFGTGGGIVFVLLLAMAQMMSI